MNAMNTPLVLAVILSVLAAPLAAGPITRACLEADRNAASPGLCNCIQAAANHELSRADQRMASKFFRDPHRAQEIRQSDRRSHEAFWDRYQRFGARAQSMCG